MGAILGPMSEENVEIVRRGFEAYSRRDVDGFLSHLDPEVELRSAIVGGAEGKVYRGHDGVRKWIADSDESFIELVTDLSEFRDVGDQVLAFGHIRARGRESGLELESPTGWVFAVRDGKLVKAEGFLSTAAALEAVGLRA
jgi:ketosteroid isomerase-like protein